MLQLSIMRIISGVQEKHFKFIQKNSLNCKVNAMNAAIAILLYLGVISSPSEYHIKFEHVITPQQQQEIDEAYYWYQQLQEIQPDNPRYDFVKKQFIVQVDDVEI